MVIKSNATKKIGEREREREREVLDEQEIWKRGFKLSMVNQKHSFFSFEKAMSRWHVKEQNSKRVNKFSCKNQLGKHENRV